jgi:uncharacterized protein (TIRG00374 family)
VTARFFRSFWLRLAVTTAILGYVLSRIELSAVAEAFAQIDAQTYLLLLVVVAGDRFLAGSRWFMLVRASGIPLSLRLGARLFLISSFLGSFLPAGLGGDIARTWELSQRTQRTNEALAVAVIDRWLGLASVVALGVIGLARWSGPVPLALPASLYGLFTLVLLVGTAGVFSDSIVSKALPRRWAEHAAMETPKAIASAVGAFRGRGMVLAAVVIVSFALQSLRVVLAWLIGLGLGLEVPLSYYFVFMPVGIVLILLPISVGGLGPAQGAIIWMLKPLGVPDSASFAMSTLFILLGYVGNLPGALLYLKRRK